MPSEYIDVEEQEVEVGRDPEAAGVCWSRREEKLLMVAVLLQLSEEDEAGVSGEESPDSTELYSRLLSPSSAGHFFAC